MNFLLDTNTIIYLSMIAWPWHSQLDDTAFRSSRKSRCYRSQTYRSMKNNASVPFFLSLTGVAISEPIRDQAITSRRLHRLKLPDAIVAATAMVGNAVLLNNDKKLESIPICSSGLFRSRSDGRMRSFSTPITRCSSAW